MTLSMECTMNLVWAAMGVLMFGACLLSAVGTSSDRRRQLAALAMVLLILFPVISVSDDLLLARNPAEIARSERKGQVCAQLESAPHFSAEHMYWSCAELFTGPLCLAGGIISPAPLAFYLVHDAYDPDWNRPPPSALPAA